jgi:hypothetical protein
MLALLRSEPLESAALSEIRTSPGGDLFSPSRTRYVHFPAPCSKADYDQVVDRYVERARKLPGVSAVAQFGNVSAPGISDLDFVVVAEPDLPPESGKSLGVQQLPEFDRELMMHDPYVVPADGVRHLFDHLDVPELTPLWGSLPACARDCRADDRWRRLSILLEWLPPSQQYFASLARYRRVDVRWALPVLHSLRHPLELAAEFLGEPLRGARAFTQGVELLRAEWFNLNTDAERARRLADVLTQGWFVTAELCWNMDRWLLEEGALSRASGTPTCRILASAENAFLVLAHLPAASDFVRWQVQLIRPWPVRPILRRLLRNRMNDFTLTILPRFQLAHLMAVVGRAPTVLGPVTHSRAAGWPCDMLRPQTAFEHYLAGLALRIERQARFMARGALGFGQACSPLIFDPGQRPAVARSWPKRWLRSILYRRAIRRAWTAVGYDRR